MFLYYLFVEHETSIQKDNRHNVCHFESLFHMKMRIDIFRPHWVIKSRFSLIQPISFFSFRVSNNTMGAELRRCKRRLYLFGFAYKMRSTFVVVVWFCVSVCSVANTCVFFSAGYVFSIPFGCIFIFHRWLSRSCLSIAMRPLANVNKRRKYVAHFYEE